VQESELLFFLTRAVTLQLKLFLRTKLLDFIRINRDGRFILRNFVKMVSTIISVLPRVEKGHQNKAMVIIISRQTEKSIK
jgi:hypothetical protein